MNRSCTLGGCDAKHYARGWCRNHYQRWWSPGDDPVRAGRPTGPDHPLWTGAEASYSTAHARVAYRRGKAAAQVLIRWSIQLGNVVIPRSANPEWTSRLTERRSSYLPLVPT